MLSPRTLLCAALLVGLLWGSIHSGSTSPTIRAPRPVQIELRPSRSSALDLEIAGDLIGQPFGSTRFLTRQDLLALPQVHYTVSDDANFAASTQISGVTLEELAKKVAASPDGDMIVAICNDRYLGNYPRDYIAAHHPLLVLLVNGQSPEHWPKDPGTHRLDMGPYLISHPKFTPSFTILSHADEPQIPWGVVRLEFRGQNTVFDAIAPRGPHAQQSEVQAGFQIARQNCFRCHNRGEQGGQKALRPWAVLWTLADASPEYFAAYVRDPKSKNPQAQMPGFPNYDNATIGALRAYFSTFSGARDWH